MFLTCPFPFEFPTKFHEQGSRREVRDSDIGSSSGLGFLSEPYPYSLIVFSPNLKPWLT